jgi:hypothetical protein
VEEEAIMMERSMIGLAPRCVVRCTTSTLSAFMQLVTLEICHLARNEVSVRLQCYSYRNTYYVFLERSPLTTEYT